MKISSVIAIVLLFSLVACNDAQVERPAEVNQERVSEQDSDFKHEAERFADMRILRYRVPGFEELDLEKKKLLYFLYEAALCGREIIYDQKYRYNLSIKRTLEQLIRKYPGDRSTKDFRNLLVYAKQIWFANGIHHHYSSDKFNPGFSYESFAAWVKATPGTFPLRPGQSVDALLAELKPVIFDPAIDAKLVNKKRGSDLVLESAANFYGPDVTQKEVEAFYAKKRRPNDERPVEHGLNSRLVNRNGTITERVWKVGGLYTEAITKIVYWLEKAVAVAENNRQRDALQKLVAYYKSGNLSDWDAYNVAWIKDTDSDVDVINGFIEVYNDSMGYRGSFESVVSVRDPLATKRIDAIARQAQWFEDNSPLIESHKKRNVKGITGKVITVVVESGDASPTTPIGINLPNSNWVRKHHGSKSVNLSNIVAAYNQVGGASLDEFTLSKAEADRERKYGELADMLHTDMHEVIGHASGQINPGIGTPKETLKNYASTLEEARADLVALYYMIDPKLVEMGLMESLEVGKAAYDGYIRNGLMTQLRRIKLGDVIEQDHMRNRQLVSLWAFQKGAAQNVIERKQRGGKTYYVINDYVKLRRIFGDLLREIQRIKSEGDFKAGEHLVETYGVKIDQKLHEEVLDRYATLDTPAYSGFINPVLVPVRKGDRIVDVRIQYPADFTKQMLYYAKHYAFLPSWN